LLRQHSYIIMQTEHLRQNEIETFSRDRENAEILVDHLQNWIDGILPLISSYKDIYESELGIYLTAFWPELQSAIFLILGGAYFDGIRTLRFTLESILVSIHSQISPEESFPGYYTVIKSLSFLTEEEREEIGALYGKMSLLAHPSQVHLERLFAHPELAFAAFYEPELFGESLRIVDSVAGAVFRIIIELFPEIGEKAKREKFFYESLKRLPFIGILDFAFY